MSPYRRLRLILAIREVVDSIGQGLFGPLIGAAFGWPLAEWPFPRA